MKSFLVYSVKLFQSILQEERVDIKSKYLKRQCDKNQITLIVWESLFTYHDGYKQLEQFSYSQD